MKAGLYIRLSINDSLNDSINNQTNILKEYCYINNISIYDIYIDNGYTGTNYNRPEFNRLIRDIEKIMLILSSLKIFRDLEEIILKLESILKNIFQKIILGIFQF